MRLEGGSRTYCYPVTFLTNRLAGLSFPRLPVRPG